MTLPANHPLEDGRTSASALVTTYRGTRGDRTPVWFMRQAGRSLPEYRELRVGTRMLDACLDPAMASEITLQPVRRHGVDAGIFFSDIVIPLKLAGVDVEIEPGRGPVLAKPVRTLADVSDLQDPAGADFSAIAQGVALTVAALGSTPLIGFAGAPFTLAAYLVEGGPSKDHIRARTLMHSDPEAWDGLLTWAADVTGAFLRAQVLAGTSAAQLFDSWVGSLSKADYVARVAPYSARALAAIRDLDVPVVHFGVGSGEVLAEMRDVGAGGDPGAPRVDAVGVDWRIPLDEAARRLGGSVTVQGNVDPALLAAPWPVLEAHVLDVLRRGRSARAHVLNLGHGVPPETDPAVLTRIVELVHAQGGAAGGEDSAGESRS
ncbi:uroporphyrinogen decarboxylase [Herbiconiux sp. CPCC 203407]|uniref:Uroporphyrinogen decarboxylase n=1 Tax=Herbiconiux oxytropis TaxID=2970915 RepID=A0AA42BTE7_9MICO|nr:uroporphyrinogen decarboxylase [Herbiconiux oxytropis]MCS5724030.1 uroporphyrinogen decarboxylase [Herbiconiux oxytropis]MCS5725091.1 uroporphyrinogen decarboxylase [Herbiconiux oxytropis]